MKKIIAFILAAMMFTSVASASYSTVASNAGPTKIGQPGSKFAAHKQQVLSEITQRSQLLQTVQSCIQNAQDREAIKACREQSHGNPVIQQ